MISKPVISRILAGTLFIVGGSCLALLSLFGAPSFWYLPTVYALVPLGFVWWFCRPSLAAALSVGPILAAAALTRYLSGTSFTISSACLVAALVFVFVGLRGGRRWKLPLIISIVYLAGSFCTDRLFTNKVSIKSFEMGVALDGKAPWGEVGPEWQDGTAPILLYRRVGTSYCFLAFKSQELHDRLAQERRNTVTVEYNVFSDFGRERGYNVRSVDGVVLANGMQVIKGAERFGGQVLTDGSSGPNCW